MIRKLLTKNKIILEEKEYEALTKHILSIYQDIIQTGHIEKMKKITQHGNCSCHKHSVGVAYISLLIAYYFNIHCDYSSLVKASLLHDYFLYKRKSGGYKLHGFTHPKHAMNNAIRDYSLNRVEKNAILRHMFPLNPIPPIYMEGIIITIADKICAIYEFFCKKPYTTFEERIKELSLDTVTI